MFLAMVQVVQAGKSLWAGAYHKGLWGGGGGQEVGRVGAHCRRQERVKEKGMEDKVGPTLQRPRQPKFGIYPKSKWKL